LVDILTVNHDDDAHKSKYYGKFSNTILLFSQLRVVYNNAMKHSQKFGEKFHHDIENMI